MPDEFRIKEYDEGVKLLDEVREQLDNGEIMSILVMSERTDGGFWGGCTGTQNVYALTGYALMWALKRMGFVHDENLKKLPGEL